MPQFVPSAPSPSSGDGEPAPTSLESTDGFPGFARPTEADWSDAVVGAAVTPDDDSPGPGISKPIIAAVVAVALALIVGGVYLLVFGKETPPSPTPSPTASAPSPTATPTTPPSLVSVPDVLGLSLEDASAAIKAAGLTVGLVEEQPYDAIPDTVVAQDPRSDVEASLGAAITLTVAVSTTVAVEDVIGLDAEAAKSLLEAQGFVVAIREKSNAQVRTGTVFAQSPKAGVETDRGDRVIVTIAATQIKVPNVTGQKEAAAVKTLEVAGFKVKVVKDPKGKKGLVTSQKPTGTAVKGSTVTIAVGTK